MKIASESLRIKSVWISYLLMYLEREAQPLKLDGGILTKNVRTHEAEPLLSVFHCAFSQDHWPHVPLYLAQSGKKIFANVKRMNASRKRELTALESSPIQK